MSLHFSTKVFNSLPPRLVGKSNRKLLLLWWDFGAVAVLGLFLLVQLVLPLAALSGVRFLWSALQVNDDLDEDGMGLRLVERAFVETLDGRHESNSGLLLRPLVPGVTMAWSSLPVFFSALCAAQSWHEFGHALAAATDGIPTLSVGAHFLLLFPTLYVALPSPPTSLSELRIATAGVWHNLVMLGVAWVLSVEGLGVGGYLLTPVYSQSTQSVTVVSVSNASPLAPYLSPGDRIVKLDDLNLAGSPLSTWESYLNSDAEPSPSENLGWCLPLASYTSTSSLSFDDCCPSSDLSSPNICFVAHADNKPWQGCFDPLPFWPPSTNIPSRCVNSIGCGDPGSVCSRAAAEEQILRIELAVGSEKGGRVVVYQGGSKGVFAQVQVTGREPRFTWLPMQIQFTLEEFFRYLHSLSLALGFFNLLPLPNLDGQSIFTSFFFSLVPYSNHFTAPSSTQMYMLEEGIDPQKTLPSSGMLTAIVRACRPLGEPREVIEGRLNVLRRWNILFLIFWVGASVVKFVFMS